MIKYGRESFDYIVSRNGHRRLVLLCWYCSINSSDTKERKKEKGGETRKMSLLEELYEKSGSQGPNGLFPGSELGEMRDGSNTIQAMKVRTEFLTPEERVRLKSNFQTREEGDNGEITYIIERPKKQEKQKKPNFLARIIKIV